MAVKVDDALLARIGFAERWLNRARDQCAEGNLARSVLTLALADAEMHHALEAVGVPTRRRVRRSAPGVVLLAAAALACILLLALRAPVEVRSGASAPAPPVVRLASTSGALLQATVLRGTVPSVQTVAAPQVTNSAQRVATPAPVLARPRALTTAGEPVRFTQPAGEGNHLAVGPAVPLSMSELIDLTLTAERVLRKDPAGLTSP